MYKLFTIIGLFRSEHWIVITTKSYRAHLPKDLDWWQAMIKNAAPFSVIQKARKEREK